MANNPFDEAKPRTPQGEAKQREQVAKQNMRKLLEMEDEGAFQEGLEVSYGIKRGTQQSQAAVTVWRQARALRAKLP